MAQQGTVEWKNVLITKFKGPSNHFYVLNIEIIKIINKFLSFLVN